MNKPVKVLIFLVLVFAVVYGTIRIVSVKPNKNVSFDKEKTLILTSFYPVYLSAINVAKDIKNVSVVNMTKPQTGCLHDYTLTTNDLKMLEKAKIFVINGAGMETFINKVLKEHPHLKIVDASKGIKLLKDKSTGEINGHVWVSISDNILQVKNIAKQFSVYNPENKGKYLKNAAAYIDKLEAQREKMHKGLDKLKNRNIITFHEAFPYFAKEFNLNIVDVIEREPGSAPSAGEIKETVKIIKKHNVKALFAEPQYPAKAAQTIAAETGLKVYYLDPAASGELNPDAYIKIMDNNLKSLQEALH